MIEIICNSCGNKNLTERDSSVPKEAHYIKSNYCTKCEKLHDGDYWIEEYYDIDAKLIIETQP